MNLIFETLTLLISPLIDFFNASQAMRWYSLDDLSVICDCSARRRAGGMYVPPERMVSSFSYSAFAAACFSSSVRTGGADAAARPPLAAISRGSSRWPLRRGVGDLRRACGEGDLRRGVRAGDLESERMRDRSRPSRFGESSSILSSSSFSDAFGSSVSPFWTGVGTDLVGDLEAGLTGDWGSDLDAVRPRNSGFKGIFSSSGASFCSGVADLEDITGAILVCRVAGLMRPRLSWWREIVFSDVFGVANDAFCMLASVSESESSSNRVYHVFVRMFGGCRV